MAGVAFCSRPTMARDPFIRGYSADGNDLAGKRIVELDVA
jgi:hypothetical protein